MVRVDYGLRRDAPFGNGRPMQRGNGSDLRSQPLGIRPQTEAEGKRLAAKGRKLLERYHAAQEKA